MTPLIAEATRLPIAEFAASLPMKILSTHLRMVKPKSPIKSQKAQSGIRAPLLIA